MTTQTFAQLIDERIAKYDLLCHPYYKAWSMGELTRENIRDYACSYYHHVAAFPEYLNVLQGRLPDGPTRAIVLENKADEDGITAADKRSHADLWLDFAEGMGANRNEAAAHQPIQEIEELIQHFQSIAENGSTVEALAALYAYESQIPKVAAEKERGLKDLYAADETTCHYFTLHKSWDIHHARVWLDQLTKEVDGDAESSKAALDAAEQAAKSLWQALDGIERQRKLTTISTYN